MEFLSWSSEQLVFVFIIVLREIDHSVIQQLRYFEQKLLVTKASHPELRLQQ